MTKPTFATVLAATQEKHLLSNLENLAHAHTRIADTITSLQDLQRRIEEVAADPAKHPEGTVRKLYDEATRATRGA